MIDTQTIDRVRDAASIEDVIGKRVALKKKSPHSYVGLCPFHDDKSPSMHVSSQKQIFKCFACGTGGDVFAFLMKLDHLSFGEALKQLATDYHISLPDDGSSFNKRDKDESEEIKKVNEYAAVVYHQYLMRHQKAKIARLYAHSRGIDKTLCERFKIGYAPEEGDFLFKLLRNKYSKAILEKTGLFTYNSGGYGRDFMRERLVFPIVNERNEVLGFGGRIITEKGDMPKYLNTRDTPVFLKQNVLYGINHSYALMQQTKSVYIVEGYLDVIACVSHDIPAVAPLGTSLTESQLRRLKRLSERAHFLFDGDEAGRRAAIRACEMSMRMGVEGSVILFEDGVDPFDFFKKAQKEDFQKYVSERRKKHVDFVLDEYAKDWAKKGEREKNEILIRFKTLLDGIEDEVYKIQMIKLITYRLNVREEVFYTSQRRRFYEPPDSLPEKEANVVERQEREMIFFLLSNSSFIKDAQSLFSQEDLRDETARRLYRMILEESFQKEFHFHHFLDRLDEALRSMLQEQIIKFEVSTQAIENKESLFQNIVCRLKVNHLKFKIAQFNEKIAQEKDNERSKIYREEVMRLVVERRRLSSFLAKK